MPDTTYVSMEFSAKLRKLMKEHRYSQEMLARRLDVSQNLVGLWSRGKSIPDLKKAKLLAEVFGVTVDFLADETQEDPPDANLGETERKIWEVVNMIGPELAWKKLVGGQFFGDAPRLIPPPGQQKKNTGA